RPIDGGMVQYVRQKGPGPIAAVQVAEGDLKTEGSFVWETVTVGPVTIAIWVAASRQVLQDVPGLESVINNELLWAVRLCEEDEILNGPGTAGHLAGLMGIAASVTPVASSTGIDAIAQLVAAVAATGATPTGVVLNPADYLKLSLA